MQFILKKWKYSVQVGVLNIFHRSNCCVGYILETNKSMSVGKYVIKLIFLIKNSIG